MAKRTDPVSERADATAGTIACWCCNQAMDPFNEDYGVCRNCGTLVLLRETPLGRKPEVVDDEKDFYGKRYWLQHQEGDLGNPDIHARARNDMAERNLHWLAAVLKYRMPGARTLELGCGNGGFVGLMKLAGFDALGAEMSPWVVDYGRRTFGANILVGPVEQLDLAAGSLDAVLMMDVLEHLPDPAATLRHCLKLLKKDGVLVIQTPQYREGTTHARMVESRDPFLEQLKPEEHLYLFTDPGARKLLEDLGAAHVAFEPAIFAHYDMFFVASRAPLATHSEGGIESALLATPGGRVALALLDLRKRELDLRVELARAKGDVEFLKGRVAEAHEAQLGADAEALRNERNLLEHQLADLRGHFDESEADRAARGRVIEEQGQTIANLQAKVHEHLMDLAALTERHSVLLADHAQVEARMNDLRRQFDFVEADRIARGEVIEQQGRRATELEALVHETEKNRDSHKAEGERLSAALKERDESIGRAASTLWFRLGRRMKLL